MSGNVWAISLMAVWAFIGCAAMLSFGRRRRESRSVAAHRRALDTLESVVHHGTPETRPDTSNVSEVEPAVGTGGAPAGAGRPATGAPRPRTSASAPRLARAQEPKEVVKALIPEWTARSAEDAHVRIRRPRRRRRRIFAPHHARHPGPAAALATALATIAVAVALVVSGTVGGSGGHPAPNHVSGRRIPSGGRLSALPPARTPTAAAAAAAALANRAPAVEVLTSGPGGVNLVVPRGSHVVFAARGPCWLYATSGRSGTLFEGILQPGASRRFTLVTALQARVGAASEVKVLVDGKTVSLPAVGPNPLDIDFATSGNTSGTVSGT